MSVTIIGCGWLGFPLGKELIRNGYLVNGSVRNETKVDKLHEAKINPFVLDLDRTITVPDEIIDSTDILIISTPPLHRNEPKKYQNILNELLDNFHKVTLIIFTSSTGIYPAVAGIFDESFDFNSKQDSSILHIAEETIRQSKKEYVIFRLGGLVGPNRHPIRYLQGRNNVKNPNGPINFVHQGDCVRAIIKGVENKGMRGTFNLVHPNHPSRKEHYSEAARHYNLDAPIFNNHDSIHRVISSGKIIDDFSFEFKFPIDQYPQLNFN